MPKTLEQILGGQPNLNLQLPDYADQFRQNMQNMNLAESARAGKYVPRTQQTSDLAFRQDALTSASTPPAQKEQSTTEQKPMSYADLFVATNPYRPQTAEEREAERKRNRRNAVFAAIGDGISALSNLYFTTKGAPNAYTGGSTLSGKLYERQEQLRKERQALDQQYFNAYMNAMKMDRDEDYRNQSLQMQLKNLAHNWDRQAKQDAREAELQPYKVRYEESRAKTAEAQAKYADDLQQSKVNAEQALAGSRNRSNTGNNKSSKKEEKTDDLRFGNDVYRVPTSFWTESKVTNMWKMLTPDEQNIVFKIDGNGNITNPNPTKRDMISAIQSAVSNSKIARELSRYKIGEPSNFVERASGNGSVADGDTAGWVGKDSDTASWVGK